MKPLEPTPSLLLDYLYGLLDANEQQQVEQFLQTSSEWQAALERARQDKDIIGQAAKTSFSAVRFEPPAPPATTVREPDRTLVWQKSERSMWPRYALAASILLFLFLGGGAAVWLGTAHYGVRVAQSQYVKLNQERLATQRMHQSELEREMQEMRALQQKIQRIKAKWEAERKKVHRQTEKQQVEVIITGPQTIQAGALNQYQIQTRKKTKLKGGVQQRQLLPTKIHAKIIDPERPEADQILHEEELDNPLGQIKLKLPRGLPVKPGKQLQLQVAAMGEAGVQALVSEELPLVGKLYLTHLTTDRPMYRPGDTVRFRSLTLERFSLKPAQETFELIFTAIKPDKSRKVIARGTTHLRDESSLLLTGPAGRPIKGIGASDFTLAKDAPGGPWILEVREANNRFPPQTRKFLVNNYPAPRFNKTLEFHRKSYGPGDLVKVHCKVTRVDGNTPLKNAKVTPTVEIDGHTVEVKPAELTTDADGEVDLAFSIPGKEKLEDGEGSITVLFADNADKESINRPIPIVVDKLYVYFYPEGGDLVAGVPNRVYFEVKSTLGKPAELQGRLVDGKGKPVIHDGKPVVVETFHVDDEDKAGANQGMGTFEFVPKTEETYELKIETPIGIEGKHIVGTPEPDGVVMSIPQGVVTNKIVVLLHSPDKERKLLVGAYCRGQLLDHTSVSVAPGQEKSVTLRPAEKVSGVYRITVYEYREEPNNTRLVEKAERLIYRQPVKKLDFSVIADKKSYIPGDSVRLKIASDDEEGKSAPAIALVKVVNQSVVKLADDKTARSMPVNYYLTTEIKNPEDLEYADFLVSDDPAAEKALDLLLGTQGWRRFAEQKDPRQFIKQQKPPLQDDAKRLLLVSGQSQPKAVNLAEQAKLAVDAQYAVKWQENQQKLALAEKANRQTKQKHRQAESALQTRLANFGEAQAAAQRSFDRAIASMVNVTLGTLGAVLLLVGVFGVILGLMRYSDEKRKATPYLVTGGASLALLFLVVCGSVFILLIREGPESAWDAAQTAAKKENAAAQMDMALAEDAVVGGIENEDDAEAMPGHAEAAPQALKLENAAPPAEMAPDAKKVMPKLAPKPPRAKPNAAIMEKDAKAEQKNLADQLQMDVAGMPGDAAEPMFGGAGALPGVPPRQKPMLVQSDKALRAKGAYLQLAKQELNIPFDDLKEVIEPDRQPLMVRVYAHQHQQSADNVRRDFSDTLYWHPVLVLEDGQAEINFDLSDSLTTYEVTVWGHSTDGRLGAAKAEITAKLPFSVEPKLPKEISSTDKVTIPVSVANDTEELRSVTLKGESDLLKLSGNPEQTFSIDGNTKLRKLFNFEPTLATGNAKLLFAAQSKLGGDAIEKIVKIVPEGFPTTESFSDVLEGVARHTISLPQEWVKGSVQVRVQVFPSTLADLQTGLEAMLREPHGCFEQTSSSNYPNVMILSYLKESEQTQPEVEAKARNLLQKGYNKLVSFECMAPDKDVKKEGYEWFGGSAPPHEALTAYGLLQFGDMANVNFKVDPEMLKRTEKYLLDQRDGMGSFKRNKRALDSFGRAPNQITNAYIVWALTEYGTKADLSKELEALKTEAATSKDPYFLSLTALSLLNQGARKEAVEILKSVREQQKEDGHLKGASTSITSSQGQALMIETTSLAVLAWLRANQPSEFTESVQKAVKWIGTQRGGYGAFGSTQSTILALKALIAFTKENRKTAEAGELKLFVNNKEVDYLKFPARCQEELIVSVPSETLLKKGDNELRVEMTGKKNVFPYTLSWSYNTLKPDNDKQFPVRLTTALSKAKAREGETVKLTATVSNKTDKGQGMTMAIIGLPAGVIVPEDMKQLQQLAELRENGKKPGKIGAFEIRGRELILYWRDMAPNQTISVEIDLICRIPGVYRGPASRAYLYYQSELKHWVEPLELTITP